MTAGASGYDRPIMALLTRPDGSAWVALPAHTLVGRSSACTLRLDDPLASGEHARISFDGGAWLVRDLASRNGTFLDGERIEPGSARPLAAGARLAFGDAASAWTLVDVSPPAAMARRLGDASLIAATDGILALPSPDEILCCVLRSGDTWIAELGGEARPARDGEVLQLAGQSFLLHLPVSEAQTAEAGGVVQLDEMSLALRVSRDEERVEVTLLGRGGARVLPPRSHHYTLLTLARARLRAEAAPALAEPQRGWISVDDLCRSLAMDESRLNVELYRIRKDFAALPLHGGAGVVERRRGSRLVRLGMARVSVSALG